MKDDRAEAGGTIVVPPYLISTGQNQSLPRYLIRRYSLLREEEISASVVVGMIIWRCDKGMSSIVQLELSPRRNFTKHEIEPVCECGCKSQPYLSVGSSH